MSLNFKFVRLLGHAPRLSYQPCRAMAVLPEEAYKLDRFRCIKINAEYFDSSTNDQIKESLQASIKAWREQGIRGVWCNVPVKSSRLVPLLIEHEFGYHHAKPTYVSLVKWICEEPNNIPSYPYTNIGVGGLVIDSQDRILLVKEKYEINNHRMWKYPGGYSAQGEDFGVTAEREVFEETGVKAQFQSIVGFRHMHKFQFDCSDIYIVAFLKATGDTDITKCPHEIHDVTWMPIEEARQHLSIFNSHILDKYLLSKSTGLAIGADSVDFILGGKLNVYSLKKSSL